MLRGYVSLAAPSLLRVTVWAARLVESFKTRKHPKHVKKIIVKIISKVERIVNNFVISDESIFNILSSSRLFNVLEIIVTEQE